ncbi:hypothetical protein HK097_007606 [Rhizophlyctis rosea]|uniref:Myb-like domain-containing protein n=1 Tax=Rhizophlyctis rosea TaxID=64517 RepID=A0AAD5SIM2_9FUNG|nr:hypothetical protein HK097_007606 [Rhizophlyctis rosea]
MAGGANAKRNDILLQKRQQKQKAQQDGNETGEETSLRDTIQALRQESENIETVRKERVFDDEVTEEEMAIIQKRVALQQRQFQEYQRRELARKICKVKGVFEYLKVDEIREALADAKDDEDAAILNFTQTDYLMKLRKAIALKHTPVKPQNEWTQEQQEAYERMLERRRKAVKKTTGQEAKQRSIRLSVLRLDEAIEQLEQGVDPDKVFEGWSDARVKAYRQIGTNPNSYYYRFNAPGEKQKNGVWDKAEREVFFKRLDELGADGQWGIFSMAIPGRVGYQCSNFYRHLVKSGEIKDHNYVIDKKGNLNYLFGKKDGKEGVIRTHSKHGSGGVKRSGGAAKPSPATNKKRKRRSRYGSDDDEEDGDVGDLFDEDDSGNYTCKVSWATTRRTRARLGGGVGEDDEAGVEDTNPLPGFTDPITLDEVVKPAISPYGHVMGYDSWIRCLSNEEKKNICPLTKKPLTKRELVVLTHDNIAKYRDQIVNMSHKVTNAEPGIATYAWRRMCRSLKGIGTRAFFKRRTSPTLFDLPVELVTEIFTDYLKATRFKGWTTLLLLSKGCYKELLNNPTLIRRTLPGASGNAFSTLMILLRYIETIWKDRQQTPYRITDRVASGIRYDEQGLQNFIDQVYRATYWSFKVDGSPNLALLVLAGRQSWGDYLRINREFLEGMGHLEATKRRRKEEYERYPIVAINYKL